MITLSDGVSDDKFSSLYGVLFCKNYECLGFLLILMTNLTLDDVDFIGVRDIKLFFLFTKSYESLDDKLCRDDLGKVPYS